MATKTQLMQEDISYVNVLKYGIALNATTVNAAITDIGTVNKRTLFLTTGSWSFTTNVTVPSNITLRIPAGATISINSGVTLTLNGPLQADDPFWYTGAGTLVLNYHDWSVDAATSFIVSGGTPTVPVASLTLAAFATKANILSNSLWTYVNQAAAAVGPISGSDGVYWLLLHRDTTTAVSGWTRQSGTSYLWQLNASQPVAVAGSMLIASVTVSGGVITIVQPYGATNSQGLVVSLSDAGIVQGDDPAVNAAPLLQRALTRLQATGGTLYVPNGTYLIENFRIVYNSIHALSIIGASQDALFKRGTMPANLPLDGGGIEPISFDVGMINIHGTSEDTLIPSVTVHNCSFDFGGSIAGPFNTSQRGLNIHRADHVSVTHNKFEHGNAEMLFLGFYGPTYLKVGKYHYVADNHFEDWAQDAINPNALETRIVNNTFKTGSVASESARGYTVFEGNTLEYLTGGLSMFNPATIANNRFLDCGTSATAIASASIIDLSDGGYGLGFSGSIVTGNFFYNTIFAGTLNLRAINTDRIAVGFYNDRIKICDNSMFGQGQAIVANALRKSSICDNDIQLAAVADTLRGVSLGDVLDTLVEGNTIAYNGGTVQYIYDNLPWDATENNVIAWNFVGQLGWVWGLTHGVGVTFKIPTLTNNSTTPNVKNFRNAVVGNTAATNLTTFTNGTDNQELTLFFSTANTQLIHAAGVLLLRGAVNVTPAATQIIRFLCITNVWYEVSRNF